MKSLLALALLALALVLTACSGGGSSQAAVVPPPPPVNHAVVEVGPAPQQVPTIQAALNLVALDQNLQVITVSPGTYDSFTIDPQGDPQFKVRIIAEAGGAVVIDASAAPVRLSNLILFNRIEFSDLTITSASPAHPTVIVENSNPSAVVFDELSITAGPGQTAVMIDESIRVAIQRSGLSGSKGLSLLGTSMAVASRSAISAIEVLGFSYLRTVEVNAGSTVVGQWANMQAYTGIMPDLNVPEFVAPGQLVSFQLQGEPQSLWFIGVSENLDWYEVPLFQFPLVGLMDLFNTYIVFQGMYDAAGFATQVLSIPANAVLDVPLAFQGLSYDPATTEYRWTNVVSVVSPE